jgi:hypothetical protein
MRDSVEWLALGMLVLFPLSNFVLGLVCWMRHRWITFGALMLFGFVGTIVGSIPALDELGIMDFPMRHREMVMLGVLFSFGSIALCLQFLVWYKFLREERVL